MTSGHLAILAERCAVAGVHWDERELVLALARAGACAAGIVTAQVTRAQLASQLGVSERTLSSWRARLEARALPWLTIQRYRRGWRAALRLEGDLKESCSRPEGELRESCGRLEAELKESCERVATDASRTHAEMSRAQAPATSAPTDYVSSRSSLPAAQAPTREDGDGKPASLPVADALEESAQLAHWLHRQLTERRADLTQDGCGEVPTVSALRGAVDSILSAMGSTAAARCYCEQRLTGIALRPPHTRPGQLARLVGWLVRDAAEPELRRAAQEAAHAATQPVAPGGRRAPEAPRPQGARRPPGVSQAFESEGYADALDAAVTHGTRNLGQAPARSATDLLYEEECRSAWRAAQHFGDVPRTLPYSEELLDRYGLRPSRDEVIR